MTTPSRKLTLSDIADLRQYERERDEFRAHVIALKQVRRVAVGPVISLVFENRDTVRFQIQEMARAERMGSDAAIENELATYNPLVPDPGQLTATLFLELTTDDELRTWLPRLVGIERAARLVLADGTVVAAQPEPSHAAHLTRDDTTASVHYVFWTFTPDEVAAFSAGAVAVAFDHPNYPESTTLSDPTHRALLADLVTDHPA